MAFVITDIIEWWNPDGTQSSQAGSFVYAYPIYNTVRRKGSDGFFHPIMPNTNLPGPFQYGNGVAIDNMGNFTLNLPYSGDQSPSTQIWAIQLPSGLVLQGIPPNAGGPSRIDDLLTSLGWNYVAGTTNVGAGTAYEQSGEVVLTGQDNFTVLFSPSLAASTYTVQLGFQTDQVGGGVPTGSFDSRSKTSCPIRLSQGFNGTLTWRAQVE